MHRWNHHRPVWADRYPILQYRWWRYWHAAPAWLLSVRITSRAPAQWWRHWLPRGWVCLLSPFYIKGFFHPILFYDTDTPGNMIDKDIYGFVFHFQVPTRFAA